MDVYNEFQKLLKMEETTSDVVIRREILRQIIYKESDLIAVGTKVVAVRNFGELDIKWSFPSELTAEYPVPEGVVGEIKGPITYTDFTMTLQKGEVRVSITDEAKLRQLDQFQVQHSRRRASEALAKEKDKEILNTLKDYANQTVTVASGSEWNSGSATADPEKDIIEAWGKVFSTSNASDADMRNCFLVVPAVVYPELLKLQLIGNIQQKLSDYLRTSYNMDIYPTRQFTDDAIFGLRGEQTAIHGVLQTNVIPLVEERRVGTVTEYTIRQYFKTKVVPESSTVTKSNRLCVIKNVAV